MKYSRRKYSISRKEANDMLQNVFNACNQQPNNTSLDLLLLKNYTRVAVVKTGKWLSIAFLIIVLLMPLAFRRPAGTELTLNNNDANSIIISNHQMTDDHFSMYMQGEGILYNNIYCQKQDGTIVFPDTISEENGYVSFPFDGEMLNIFIPCEDGYTVQALLAQR